MSLSLRTEEQYAASLQFYFSLALQPPLALPSAFFSFVIIFTDGRTPWTSDKFVARPLPKHRTTQTQNKHIHTPNINALCGIRTHDQCCRASEDSTCLITTNINKNSWNRNRNYVPVSSDLIKPWWRLYSAFVRAHINRTHILNSLPPSS
jgi:hypothetical protein